MHKGKIAKNYLHLSRLSLQNSLSKVMNLFAIQRVVYNVYPPNLFTCLRVVFNVYVAIEAGRSQGRISAATA